jgi:hypothetical protein
VDGAAVGAFIAYAAARIVAPYVPIEPTRPTDVALTVGFVVLALYVSARIAYAERHSFATEAIACALSVGVFVAFALILVPVTRGHWAVVAVADLVQLVAAVSAGVVLSRVVREAKLLPALIVTVAVVDVVGVLYGGPVSQAMQSDPDLVAKFSQRIPEAGSKTRPSEPGEMPEVQYVGTAGIGDLLFTAFFFACVGRFALDYRRTLGTTLVLGSLGMLIALVSGSPMPALPFLAVGVLVVNRRHFHYTREEKTALAVASVFLVAFCLLMVYLTRRLQTGA